MLTDTEKFLIQILADYFHGQKSNFIENIDFYKLNETAYIHGVSGIVFYQLKDKLKTVEVPKIINTSLFKAYADTCFAYEKRIKFLHQIDEAFNKEKIPYAIIKGTEIAEFYPVKKLRTMGDSDILVHTKDKDKAHKVLISMGFTNINQGARDWSYTKDGIDLELHHELVYNEAVNSKPQKTFFDKKWNFAISEDNSVKYHFSNEFHLVYLISHLWRHFISKGVGIRFFMDLAAVSMNADLDWQLVEKYLAEIGLVKFGKTCFAFCKRWFNIQIPLGTEPIDDNFYEEETLHVLKNGSHGTCNEDNNDNFLLYINNKKNSSVFSRLKWKFLFLFPSYHNLRCIPQYSFIDKKPFLLPFVWIYRFFYGFIKRICKSKKNGNTVFITEEQVSKRAANLEKWNVYE